MENNQINLLEQYIAGKDRNKYEILESIYDECAEVEFELNTSDITFPKKIVGRAEIAKILSADFNRKYEKVKTYYLSKNFTDPLNILNQKWLVVMKEIGNDVTRIGTGYYNWKFRKCQNELKIAAHKIYIHAMLEIEDIQSMQLKEIQRNLDYPWVEKQIVVRLMKNYKNLADIAAYLMQ